MKKKRENKEYLDKEALFKREKRKDPAYREIEKLKDKRSKARKRNSQEYCNRELRNRQANKAKQQAKKYLQTALGAHRKESVNIANEALFKLVGLKFNVVMKPCTQCDQLWYSFSGRNRRHKDFKNQFICDNCFSYLNKKKGKTDLDFIPPLSKKNNVRLNEIPHALKILKRLELRLLAPRQAFLWMSRKPVSNEAYSKGALCLFPADTVRSQKVISDVASPSIPCQDPQIINLNLRRRVTDKKTVVAETVRPNLMKEAAQVLEKTTLYKSLNIKASTDLKDYTFQIHPDEEIIQESLFQTKPESATVISEEAVPDAISKESVSSKNITAKTVQKESVPEKGVDAKNVRKGKTMKKNLRSAGKSQIRVLPPGLNKINIKLITSFRSIISYRYVDFLKIVYYQ